MIGVEAGGTGIAGGRHAARFQERKEGILHGTHTYVLQDENGQVRETHSISAGLDYPAVGPEHANLFDTGRAEYAYATDAAALEAFGRLARTEGILPALEPSHALAHLYVLGPCLADTDLVVVNLSGRGDKDVETVQRLQSPDARP